MMQQITLLLALTLAATCSAFAPSAFTAPSSQIGAASRPRTFSPMPSLQMAEETEAVTAKSEEEAEEELDEPTRLALEKQRRVEELKSQEVFIQRATGIHKCTNCDWEYDEKKGDSFMIGGMIKPDTPFDDLPSNWRCPTCRASKDNFVEITQEIPGFEVNQGYGFGGNSMTSGQKSGIVFGGLFLFFVLFLGGYGLS